jgi:Signal transduction histidine kinase
MMDVRRLLSGSIQKRLFIILAMASTLVTIASLLAIFAMSRVRSEFESVSTRELPETTAALRLAQIGERLQGRAPALIAAADEDQRAKQMRLIAADLQALGGELDHLKAAKSRETDLIADISISAQELRDNLTAIGDLQATRAALAYRLKQALQRSRVLEDRIRQTLGPSILAITDAVDRGIARNLADVEAPHRQGVSPNSTFINAVAAQAPLRDAERLADTALNSLLIAVEARDDRDLETMRERFHRTLGEWRSLIPTMPAGLRLPLSEIGTALAAETDEPDSVFRLRREELQTLQQADALIVANRQLADRLAEQVDRLVATADAAVTRAERAIDATIVHRTLLLIGLSIVAIVTAVLLSYLFVIRDLGAGLRGVTSAMMRLAGGEHAVTVPATDRRDEIGDLARAFAVFRANAHRLVTLDRQLIEKSNLLVATFDNMNDGFSVYDGGARLVAWNAQFAHLYDLPDAVLIPGTPIAEIQRLIASRGAVIRGHDGEPIDAPALAARRLLTTQAFEVEMPGGQTIELRSNPIPSGGFVTIHIDVTERKAIERQLRQAQKMEVVGQLTGGLAHDFNNLLAVIQGNLHLLEDQLEDRPDLRDRVSRAIAAGERAAMQIERLLAFARRQKLRPEIVDVATLIDGIIDLLECSVGRDVVVGGDLADALPPVRVDPGQLENALLNLALNARDAMDGQGSLTIAARPELTSEPNAAAFVEIAVRDSGRGMPADVLERAIEPFYTTKPPGRGSGLGLSMVYGFVRQSGGTFRINSSLGRGTTVVFTLPVADDAATANLPLSAATTVERCPKKPAAGETILVVEDDAALCEIVADQVRRLGYRVVKAGNAEDALTHLRAEPDVRLLFTDIALGPGADGFSLAQAARAMRPSLAVIYTSGEPPAPWDGSADSSSSRAFLQKPVTSDDLAAALASALGAAGLAHTSSTAESKT